MLLVPFVEWAMAAPVPVDTLVQKNAFALSRGSLPLLGAEIGDAGAIDLAGRADLPPVHTLALGRNGIGPAGLEAVLDAAWLQAPRSLDLQANPALGPAGFRALGRADKARTLTELWLAGSGGTAAAYADLVGPGNLAALERLQAGLDAAGDVGAIALLGLANLRFLVLKQAGVGPVGARTLLSHPTLESIDMSGNPIGGALVGITTLPPRLQALTARGCGLGALDLAALVRVDVGGLAHLDIGDNAVGDDGVRALAAAPWLGRLQSLTLMRSGASSEAITQLRAAWGRRGGLSVGR